MGAGKHSLLANDAREPREWLSERLSKVLLAVVVTGAAMLAAYWAFLTPIYQAPDEPINLDYALAIYENGGLFRVRHTSYFQLPPFVHPYTRYLLERLEHHRVTFHNDQRMPPGYGTLAFFRDLEQHAPSRQGLHFERPNQPAAVYPFGYYALVAVWIGFLHLFDDGPVFTFFGVRLLSVLMLIASLLLIHATLRRSHFRRFPALCVTASIAYFPLTLFVASAVQMDNLTFLLVSAVFYLAVRARQELKSLSPSQWTASLSWIITGLGFALAALLVTKVHFFLCVAAPVYLMLLTELGFARVGFCRWSQSALLLLVPSLLSGSIYLWTIWGTSILHFSNPQRGDNVVVHTLQWFLAACADFYAGLTHRSFWGIFGWMDTPIRIRGGNTNEAIRITILLIGWCVLALTLLRLEQVVSRLVRLARKGKKNVAWRLAVSDVMMNSYIVFTIFMIYLFIRVENRFHAQGRNWLPLILPIFLTGIRFAPKALTLRPSQWAMKWGVIAGLLLYDVVGGYYSLQTIKKRFYATKQETAVFQALEPSRLPRTGLSIRAELGEISHRSTFRQNKCTMPP
ncbi:MAG: hypothetical protein KatS3mg105_2735 [Gemmatales bacterium]|nr:MAG: hypothetical protein KatS3mg105_2735 [Gemmatales bacterium]